MRKRIRVLIVDDCPLERALLVEMLGAESDFDVVGEAADAGEAREQVRALDPDVLTLDVSMPGMGIDVFLKNLMRLRPMPVVLCVQHDEHAAATLEALRLGAVDFVRKPGPGGITVEEYREALVERVRAAAYAKVQARVGASVAEPGPAPAQAPALAAPPGLIAIGASTGGVPAIEAVLAGLPETKLPAIVITQHLPAGFSRPFAQRLDARSPLTVREAQDGLPIEPGHAYVAPGGHQFAVRAVDGALQCHVERASRVNQHRPSVDVLFRSVARHAGPRAVGVMLTGLGRDGAGGLLAMRQAGAYNLAQDEASSLVWDMPGEAVRLGAAHDVFALDQIPAVLGQLAAPRGAG